MDSCRTSLACVSMVDRQEIFEFHSNSHLPQLLALLHHASIDCNQQTLAPTAAQSSSEQPYLQRLYETDDYMVSLWEESLPGEEGSYIITQLYSRQEYSSLRPDAVLFVGMTNGIVQKAVRETNEFHIPRLLPDTYLIHCWLDDNRVLTIHNVRIGDI